MFLIVSRKVVVTGLSFSIFPLPLHHATLAWLHPLSNYHHRLRRSSRNDFRNENLHRIVAFGSAISPRLAQGIKVIVDGITSFLPSANIKTVFVFNGPVFCHSWLTGRGLCFGHCDPDHDHDHDHDPDHDPDPDRDPDHDRDRDRDPDRDPDQYFFFLMAYISTPSKCRNFRSSLTGRTKSREAIEHLSSSYR